jgi:hypothetical protein
MFVATSRLPGHQWDNLPTARIIGAAVELIPELAPPHRERSCKRSGAITELAHGQPVETLPDSHVPRGNPSFPPKIRVHCLSIRVIRVNAFPPTLAETRTAQIINSQ